MTTWLAGIAAKYGIQAASTAVNYSADVIGGHMALNGLDQIKKGFEGQGEKVGGFVGKSVGGFFGRSVAGHSLPLAKNGSENVAKAVRFIGGQAINQVTKRSLKVTANPVVKIENVKEAKVEGDKALVKAEPKSLVSRVSNVAGTVGMIGGGLALVTGFLPAASIGLLFAASQSTPKIVNAMMSYANPKENVNFLDDIVVPVMTQAAICSAGVVVDGVVRYETVQTAYTSVVQAGEKIGRGFSFFMPEAVQNTCGAVGRWIGHVEAGRFAMTDGVLQQASANGTMAKNATELGLEALDGAINKSGAQKGVWNTAWKIGLVTAGVLGGVVLAASSPELALIGGGAAVLGVADRAITWAKQQMVNKEEASEAAKPADKIAQKIEDLILVPVANHKAPEALGILLVD